MAKKKAAKAKQESLQGRPGIRKKVKQLSKILTQEKGVPVSGAMSLDIAVDEALESHAKGGRR